MAVVHVWADNRIYEQLVVLRERCARKWPAATLILMRPKYFSSDEVPKVDQDGNQTQAEECVGVATTADRVDILQAYANIDVEAVTTDAAPKRKIAKAPDPFEEAKRAEMAAATPSKPATAPGTQVDSASVRAILERNAGEVIDVVDAVDEVPFLQALVNEENKRERPRVTVLRAIEAKLYPQGE